MGKQKKRSTREVIEGLSFPGYEHRLMKYPGLEAGDITDYTNLDRDTSANADPIKKKQYLKLGNGKRYSLIHDHMSKFKPNFWEKIFNVLTWGYALNDVKQIKNNAAIHGGSDIRAFLFNPGWKSMPVAVTDPKTGKVLGYNILKKTKKTPKCPVDHDLISDEEFNEGVSKWEYTPQILDDAEKYDDIRMAALAQHNPEHIRKVYDQFLNKYHLRSRFIPAEGYQVNSTRTTFTKKKSTNLEDTAVATAIISLVGIFVLLSERITGYVLLNNLANSTKTYLSIVFLFTFISSFLLFIKLKRKTEFLPHKPNQSSLNYSCNN
jgi:hypothetical protein